MAEFTNLSDVVVDGMITSSSQGNLVGSLTELPIPSRDYLNLIVLYNGQTTAELDKDRFYQCRQSATTGNYEWVQLDIGGGGGGGSTVVPSTEIMSGVPTAKSMTVDGNGWNFSTESESLEITLVPTGTGEYVSTITEGDFQKLKNGNCVLKAQMTIAGFGGGVYSLVAHDLTYHTTSDGGVIKESLFGTMTVGNKTFGDVDIKKEDGKVTLTLVHPADKESLETHIADVNNPHAVTKAQVGLGNVDNTSDMDKPISTATQTALDGKGDKSVLDGHIADTNNPHAVTKAQVGLGNADNTSDADKPISTATQTALNTKQDVNNMTNTLDGELSDLYPSATLLKTESAKKEDILNKKTVIADTTATDDYYPTVKATRDFVNSSIQTASANFLGSWNDWASVPDSVDGFRVPPKKNDYIVVLLDESHGHLGQTWRYKYLWNTSFDDYSKDDWLPEYKVNDEPFTDAQMKAINSGITDTLVAEISALRTELNELKQKALTARAVTANKKKTR